MSHCHIEGVLHAGIAKFPEHTSLLCVQGFASEQVASLNMHNVAKVCLLYFSI